MNFKQLNDRRRQKKRQLRLKSDAGMQRDLKKNQRRYLLQEVRIYSKLTESGTNECAVYVSDCNDVSTDGTPAREWVHCVDACRLCF